MLMRVVRATTLAGKPRRRILSRRPIRPEAFDWRFPMVVRWEDYLNPAGAADAFAACRLQWGPRFGRQRDRIEHLFEALGAQSVACLGAGVLNDIPLAAFLGAGADVHLVDWLPDAPQIGIAGSIIARDRNDDWSCLFCRLAPQSIDKFCANFDGVAAPGSRICKVFQPGPGAPPTCLSYRRGSLPYIHRQDATGGYASAFGVMIGAEIEDATSWRQAFRRANTLAGRLKGRRSRIGIADHSIDLIVSSMLMSQFELEPYGYFSKQAQARLGSPTKQEDSRLRPLMEALRTTLLSNQIEGHCDEIERIMATDGRAFVAFELFHYDRDSGRWYMVSQMHAALATLARRFDFDFDSDTEQAMDARFETPSGRSVVCHFVLRHKRH